MSLVAQRCKYMSKIKTWLGEYVNTPHENIQMTPFDANGKFLNGVKIKTVRKNIVTYFRDYCPNTLEMFRFLDYPSEIDVELNAQFFLSLLTEYVETSELNLELIKRKSQKTSNDMRELQLPNQRNNLLDDINNTTPAAVEINHANNKNLMPPYVNLADATNLVDHLVFTTPVYSSPSSITSVDSTTEKLREECIRLIKIPECYVSSEAYEKVKQSVEEEFGPMEQISRRNIKCIRKSIFLSEDETRILRPGVTKLLRLSIFW